MEYVGDFLLALLFAALFAPHADRLREIWRESLLSGQLTLFVAPPPNRAPARKRRAFARRRKQAKK